MDNLDGPYELHDGDLMLRTPVDADAAAVSAAVLSSLAELSPWMPWATEAYSDTDGLAWIRGELGPAYAFAMIVEGEFVGCCGLNQLDAANRRANLGYWVRSDMAGRGLATRATSLLCDFGHQNGWHRLEVMMSVANESSRRVAEKAGAHYEGVAQGRLLLNGEYHDAHMFSFVRAQS